MTVFKKTKPDKIVYLNGTPFFYDELTQSYLPKSR